jgi:hypothetical protein
VPGVRRGAGIVTRAELLLALSDERDLWLRRVYDAWRDGYRAGHAAGEVTGSRRTARAWHVTAIGLPLAALGPTWAELERRRYAPRGRAHFADPRPDDYAGGPVEWDGGR